MTPTLLLACYGITFALIDSSLLQGFRVNVSLRSPFFKEMLSCYFCTGTYASLVVSALVFPLTMEMAATHVLNSMAGAAFSFSLNTLVEAAERHHVYSSKKD